MELPKDILSGNYIKPRLFLCETDKTKLCQLTVSDLQGAFKFNSLSEISFEVPRIYEDTILEQTRINPFYDKIEALRLIYLEGFGYFELQGPELNSDGIKESKSCTAYSLEYTLAQKYLDDFYINTGETNDMAYLYAYEKYGPDEKKVNENYAPVTLYNPNIPELSLLHLILEKIYGWRIGHVDVQLRDLNRKFEVDRESVYDFIVGEICEKFNCYVVFDTINNTINIYAESPTTWLDGDGTTKVFPLENVVFSTVETVAIDGYKTTRWQYGISDGQGVIIFEEAPANGTKIEVIGTDSTWDTDVFVTFDNLSQEINISYDADSIKTVLTVTYGEDENIREANLGLPYLTDISYYYNVDWMGQDLYDAYGKYMEKTNNSQADYTKNTKEILKWNDHIAYEEHRLSLEYSVASVSKETVGTYYTRVKNADGSYYYAQVSLPTDYKVGTTYYSNASTNIQDSEDGNVNLLYAAIESYYYNYFNYINSESASEIQSTYLQGMNQAIDEIKGLRDRFLFVEDYTVTELANDIHNGSEAKKESSIKTFLESLWVEVGRTPLRDLYLKRYEQKRDTNASYSNKSNDNYGHYYPAVIFIESIQVAIEERNKVIKKYEDQRKIPEQANAAISESLLMDNNFTEQQLIRLNAFLREDELHIDDIVETSITDLSSSFKLKQDAMESGRIELGKISKPQLQFSMTMANVYALPEFEPIVGQFQLGNIIRVGLRPDYVKQSRLLEVSINFEDFSDFSCEFGELTSIISQSDIHADLLGQAISAGKSVATNSSYWTKGANQATSTSMKIQQGLLDATTQIKATDGTQGVVIDKYGIKLQKLKDNGEPEPEQAWLVNNMILMSDDGFKTSKAGLGKFKINGESRYGLLADAVIAGYVEGSTIVGGELYSTNYESGKKGTYFDLDNGAFELGNGAIVYDPDDGELALKNVTIAWDSTNAPATSYIEGLDDYLDKVDNLGTQLDKRAETWYQDTDPSVSWNANDLKDLHVGDLWHYTGETGTVNGVKRVKNSEWVWEKVNGKYQWSEIEVSDDVFDAIDGKAQIFTAQPQPPYYVGDLWVQGSNGDIMNCIKERLSGSYVASDWTKSSKYTDDTVAESANSLASNAKTIGDNLVKGLGFQETEITGKYVISPVIAGGTLLIGDKSGTHAQITTDGKLICTGAEISGKITATSLDLVGCTVDAKTDVSNLHDVATSGDYTKLSNKPTAKDFGIDSNKTILYTSDVTVSQSTSSNGITTKKITVGGKEYTSITDGDFILTDIGHGDGTSTTKNYTCISSKGVLTAYNAIIYGQINATSGQIGGCTIENGVLKIKNVNIGEALKIGNLPDSVAEKDDIPTKTSQLTNDSGYQNSSQVTTITNNTIKTTNVIATNLKVKAANIDGTLTANQINTNGLTIGAGNVTGLSSIATSGKYSDLSGKPTIPTKVSQLTNDSGYKTESGVTTIIDGYVDTDYVNALGITAKDISATTITGKTISGCTISGGTLTSENSNKGKITISDANIKLFHSNGVQIGSIYSNDIGVFSISSLKQAELYLHSSGTLRLKGDNNTVIDNTIVDYGTATINFSSSAVSSVKVTFNKTFNNKPVITTNQVFDDANIVVKDEDITTTGFTARIKQMSSNGSRIFRWIAIGQYE